MKIFLGVKSWLVSVAAGVVAAAFVGMLVGSYFAKRPVALPLPPPPCFEKGEVVGGTMNFPFECVPPGRVSVLPTARGENNLPYFTYRCVCPRVGMVRDEVAQIVGEMLGKFEEATPDEVKTVVQATLHGSTPDASTSP